MGLEQAVYRNNVNLGGDTGIETIRQIKTGPFENAPLVCTPDVAFEFFDDFFSYDGSTADANWIEVGDTPVIAPADGAGGILSIPTSAATDNHQSQIHSPGESFLFAATNRVFFEARVKLTEATTDDANIIVGLSDTVTADFIQDNGAGPAASYDGAVWYKIDGTLAWQFESSNAGTQVTTTNAAGNYASATWYRLGFVWLPQSSTAGIIVPYLDGVAQTPQALTHTGLQEMHAVIAVKNGGAAVETLLVDYVKVIQER